MTARGDIQRLCSHIPLTTHSLTCHKHTHFTEYLWKHVSSCGCEIPSSMFKCLASLSLPAPTNSAHTNTGSFQKNVGANGYPRVFWNLCYVSGADDVTAWSDFSRKEHITVQEVKHIERHLKRNVKSSRRVYRSLRQLTLRSSYVVAMAPRTVGATTATCLFIQGGEHPPLA